MLQHCFFCIYSPIYISIVPTECFELLPVVYYIILFYTCFLYSDLTDPLFLCVQWWATPPTLPSTSRTRRWAPSSPRWWPRSTAGAPSERRRHRDQPTGTCAAGKRGTKLLSSVSLFFLRASGGRLALVCLRHYWPSEGSWRYLDVRRQTQTFWSVTIWLFCWLLFYGSDSVGMTISGWW